ncbi:MAG: methylenetetrahydrofolate--tRNA-(uracil(54)-C(5))-methyltransferase (FADH(2)-oxidizing) TrmFO [Abditibacteriales bacterium]|nr:methylenetetrahydrofolate--tRNA-(uracil(54)-C(5))-methyltransferase (FADH(2)-oxidizing) TrmFO [Abditibacteriales bacterium]MDW8366917.1 methylenetetrahydrofolate--tRNA-(uracil(54)-C(5))-methyltransferase (FADH(2)-oxidizing) TrmFO [Abditibacteriales bacterium]
MSFVTIIGGGLAGSEAAWQVAKRGVPVVLHEMRPLQPTPVHKTALCAELVCSNTLKSKTLDRAPGLLKAEMRLLDSLILACAEAAEIPGGTALTVDRQKFAEEVTRRLTALPNVRIVRGEVTEVPDEEPVIIATGPLTSDALARSLGGIIGENFLAFFDAVSPIVDADTINRDRVFQASRYGKGEAAFLNCPMSEAEYQAFYDALRAADTFEPHAVDKDVPYFEGCMPIEELAARGRDTLRFGPMKPVGLIDPRTNRRPYAVVQLRPENDPPTMYNLVGFQTRLKWGDQARVFRLIPGLEEAEFLRYGMIHRNTFVNAPRVLLPTYQLKSRPGVFLAGQLTGTEGYTESAAGGLIAGINAARLVHGEKPLVFPPETMMGALAKYITTADPTSFQPMNANFGLLPPLPQPIRDRQRRNEAFSARALRVMKEFIQALSLPMH